MRSFVYPAEYCSLSPAEKEVVYGTFIHPILTRTPVLLCRWALGLAILFGGGFAGGFATTSQFVVLVVAWLAAERIFDVVLLRRRRWDLIKFISDARGDGRLTSHT